MEIYIVSRADEQRMHTPRLLKTAGIPFNLVVDTPEQADRALELLGGDTIVLVSPHTDLVGKRNWITEFHRDLLEGTPISPYYCGMDDNIQGFTKVEGRYYGEERLPCDNGENWRPRFNKECNVGTFIKEIEKLAKECERVGAAYGGVATMENPFFRMSKHSFRRFVKTKVFVMNASAGVTFKHPLCHDSYATAQAIALYGRVVVNNWLFYKSKWYEKGGIGSREQREEAGLLEQLDACVAEFPGLVARAKGKNSALRILRTTDAAVENWRREYGYGV